MSDYSYPVVIHHIFISPGHNYFGRPKDGPGGHATLDGRGQLEEPDRVRDLGT